MLMRALLSASPGPSVVASAAWTSRLWLSDPQPWGGAPHFFLPISLPDFAPSGFPRVDPPTILELPLPSFSSR